MKVGNFAVRSSTDYPIKPNDINTDQHFYGAFGKDEMGRSAKWIVMLCQKKRGWKPFTLKELDDFRHKKGVPGFESFSFHGLDTDQLIIKEGDEYYVTHEFITRCFLNSPSGIHD